MVALLLGLLGFTFTVQVRHVADDPTVTAQSQEDLVGFWLIRTRMRSAAEDLAELQETHRRLSTAGGQQEALAEAQRRADEIGVLAGTLPVTGPGLVRMRGGRRTRPGAGCGAGAAERMEATDRQLGQPSGAGGSQHVLLGCAGRWAGGGRYAADHSVADGGGIRPRWHRRWKSRAGWWSRWNGTAYGDRTGGARRWRCRRWCRRPAWSTPDRIPDLGDERW